LRPTRERAHDTDVLAPETKFARAPDGVHIAYQLLGDIGIVHRAFGRADSVLWLVPPDPHAKSVEAAYVDFTRPACEVFKTQGVTRVVGVSALGRGLALARNAGWVTASLAMDDLIAGTGVSYRALTMPSFMDNILRQVEAIKSRGMFSAVVDTAGLLKRRCLI
jgi:hypothetical protein